MNIGSNRKSKFYLEKVRKNKSANVISNTLTFADILLLAGVL